MDNPEHSPPKRDPNEGWLELGDIYSSNSTEKDGIQQPGQEHSPDPLEDSSDEYSHVEDHQTYEHFTDDSTAENLFLPPANLVDEAPEKKPQKNWKRGLPMKVAAGALVALAAVGARSLIAPGEDEEPAGEQPRIETEAASEVEGSTRTPAGNQENIDPQEGDIHFNEELELSEETNTALSAEFWRGSWESDAALIQGPEGDARTMEVLGEATSNLIGRIAALRQAENEQEAAAVERIQNLHGASYYIEKNNKIIEVSDPIVYGFMFDNERGLGHNWQANSASFNNLLVFYRYEGAWEHFAISEVDDVRWFSAQSARLVGAAYSGGEATIEEGTIAKSSVAESSQPITIRNERGIVRVPEEPTTFDTIDDVITAVLDEGERSPIHLLDITKNITK